MGSCVSCIKRKSHKEEYLLFNDDISVRSSDTTIDKNIKIKKSYSESNLIDKNLN